MRVKLKVIELVNNEHEYRLFENELWNELLTGITEINMLPQYEHWYKNLLHHQPLEFIDLQSSDIDWGSDDEALESAKEFVNMYVTVYMSKMEIEDFEHLFMPIEQMLSKATA